MSQKVEEVLNINGSGRVIEFLEEHEYDLFNLITLGMQFPLDAINSALLRAGISATTTLGVENAYITFYNSTGAQILDILEDLLNQKEADDAATD